MASDSDELLFTDPENEPGVTGCKRWLKRKTLIGLGIGILLAVITVVIVVLVVVDHKKKQGQSSTPAPSPSPSPTFNPTTIPEPTTTLNPIPTFNDRLECVAGPENEKDCTKSGCLWETLPDRPDVPKCFFFREPAFGFKVKEAELQQAKLEVAKGSFFGNDFKKVNVKVTEINDNIVRIQFLDGEKPRYQVPIELNSQSSNPTKQVYEVELLADPSKMFSFRVARKEDKTVLFDSSVGSLFLAEHHIEVSTTLPSSNVYGIGESTHKTFRHDVTKFNKWPLFSRDQPPNPWDGAGRYNLYGVHPYYMCLEDSGKSHGVLFLNSNAMEFTVTPMPALNFRSTGGILDIFFFVGDNPEHVTQLYTQVIGRPMIPPYWGMGFQLSHYGFNTLDNMKATIQRTRDNKFPLDVIHADIDLMEENKDFTWDNLRFPNYNTFVDQEKSENGLRFIIILDPAILANDTNYAVYKDGEDRDVFVKWPKYIPVAVRNNPPGVSKDKDIMFGKVWPNGPVAFPDFFKESTKNWWEKAIADYRKKLDFDALWIDMNEPSSFGTDQDQPWYCPPDDKKCWTLKCPYNKYDNLITFVPAASSVYNPKVKLSDKTLCMVAVQGNNSEYVHFDVHNLYGWSETEITYKALKDTAHDDQVPLVISRSTYPSSGRHAGHWLGDNMSSWESMRSSIVGMLEFNLFGIPYIGADICGFFLNSTSELCGRWMQLGAFYPFCRNHNSEGNIDQDPGSDLLEPRDKERARKAMETRYQLLPYLHTLHYLAYTNGNTVVRALFHEFPTDPKTYDMQEQFMWGKSLLISPPLYESKQTPDTYTAYLPKDLWYDFYEGTIVNKVIEDRHLIIVDTDIVPLHVRAGSILPLKKPGANSTKFNRDLDFEIRVYPKNNVATGDLYWSAKEAKDIENPKYFRLYQFELTQNNFVVKLVSNESIDKSNIQIIGTVVLCGQENKPTKIKYQGQDIDEKEISYDDTRKVLKINHEINLEELNPNDRTRTISWN